MKWILLFSLLSTSLWAKPLVLVSYYDAFGRSPFNNSEPVALALNEALSDSPVKLKLCALNTVFDKSYGQLEDCLKALGESPLFVLGLGEAGCDMKIEMEGRNWDRTRGADNEGNERRGSVIISDGPRYQGFSYPLPEMYCALNLNERKELIVSNNAGSFICNNTAYQLSYYYPEVHSGFIHLPANNCRGLERKNEIIVSNLRKMILKGAEVLAREASYSRLPVTRRDLNHIRSGLDPQNLCLKEFFSRARGVDERVFWTALD
jgi:pyrrolidone-carboxylate peptidase